MISLYINSDRIHSKIVDQIINVVYKLAPPDFLYHPESLILGNCRVIAIRENNQLFYEQIDYYGIIAQSRQQQYQFCFYLDENQLTQLKALNAILYPGSEIYQVCFTDVPLSVENKHSIVVYTHPSDLPYAIFDVLSTGMAALPYQSVDLMDWFYVARENTLRYKTIHFKDSNFVTQFGNFINADITVKNHLKFVSFRSNDDLHYDIEAIAELVSIVDNKLEELFPSCDPMHIAVVFPAPADGIGIFYSINSKFL